MIEHLESNVEEWTSKSSRMDLPLLHFIFLIQSANSLLVRLKKNKRNGNPQFSAQFFCHSTFMCYIIAHNLPFLHSNR